MRKIICILLCLLMFVLICPTTANAQGTIQTAEELYEQLADDCMNFKSKASYTLNFQVKRLNIDKVLDIIKEESQVLAGNVVMWKYQQIGNQFVIEFGYTLSKTEYDSCLQEAQKIAKQFDDNMTDYQKVKATHDYLCKAFVYSYFHDGPYDGFYKGTTDCEGYAMGFQMVMDECNIPCQYITGDNHAWNIVMLDGGWYNIDVTWDDVDGANGEDIRYDYFLKSSFDFDGHAFNPIVQPTNYNSDLSYDFSMTNLTNLHKYGIIIVVGAILFICTFEKVKHKKQLQRQADEPITFKEYNWSEQRARNAQNNTTVNNVMLNGEIIDKKEN